MRAGIDSFHLDCRTNDKISEIEAEYGIKGFGIIVRLWQKIYAENGYYCEWDDRKALLFLANWFVGNSGVSTNLIIQVVNQAIKIGLFNSDIYEKYGILTSARIQEQYFESVKRRKVLKIKSAYLLVSVRNFCPNVNIIEENADINKENAYIFEQSKVKESKVKESKVKKESIEADKPPARARFIKPSVEEIREYCTERQNNIDPETFYDHYEANGWKVGGRSPMKDWKAAVRTWERNGIKEKKATNNFNNYDQRSYDADVLNAIVNAGLE